MVYKTIDPDITQEDVTSLKNAFDINSMTIENQNRYFIQEKDRYLEIYKQPGTGCVYYSVLFRDWLDKKPTNLPTEEEAITMAKSFLESNNLLPENYYYSGAGYFNYSNYKENGDLISRWNSAIKVSFCFTINGYNIIGPGAKASVSYGENGRIVGAYCFWRDLEEDQEKEIISYDDALKSFKGKWPNEGDQTELEHADSITEITVTDVELVYYADTACIPQSYLEPVYVFNGNYNIYTRDTNGELSGCPNCAEEFHIVIPAIK